MTILLGVVEAFEQCNPLSLLLRLWVRDKVDQVGQGLRHDKSLLEETGNHENGYLLQASRQPQCENPSKIIRIVEASFLT